MSALGYVYGIGGGTLYACQRCKDMTEETREERESEGFDIPDFYGPTTLDGDAVCAGCARRIAEAR